MYRVALCLAAALAPGAAFAQSGTAAAQREIKTLVEANRAPMFADNQRLDATAMYTLTGTGCSSRLTIDYPAARRGSSSFAAHTDKHDFDWSRASTRIDRAYVVVSAPSLGGGQRHVYAGSADGAARLKSAMDRLIAACRPAPEVDFPARMVGLYLNEGAIPRAWRFAYSRREGDVYVFEATADLKASPMSAMLKGDTYLRRSVCGDEDLRDYLAKGVRMRIDTRYVSRDGTRIERGPVLSRC